MHPLVRNTSRPAAGPELLAFTELAARLLERAAAAVREAGPNRDPREWASWQLLAPHSSAVLNTLKAQPDSSGEAVDAAESVLRMIPLYLAIEIAGWRPEIAAYLMPAYRSHKRRD